MALRESHGVRHEHGDGEGPDAARDGRDGARNGDRTIEIDVALEHAVDDCRTDVDDGRTGLHFTPGDADDLAKKVEWAWAHPEAMREMGRNARAEYEAKYTAERNYEMLMDVYQQAIQEAKAIV